MYNYDREDKEPDFLDVEDNDFVDVEEDDDDEPDSSEEPDEDDEEPYERISVTIPKDFRKKVKKFAQDLNLSVSELVRGSLDGIIYLSEKGEDLGRQIEEGLKEGLKGLENGFKDIDFEKFEDIHLDLEHDFKTEEYAKKMEEYEKKMEEYAKKMEEYSKKMGEKAKRIVEKNLAHLDQEFPHVRRIKHVRPPKAPKAPRAPGWSSDEPWREPTRPEDIRFQEQERAKARAPIEKIKMLKELLDEGMITQEDYDEKKKKILEQI